jgi:glutamine amidotransferase
MCRLLYIRSKKQFPIRDHLEKFAHIAKNSKEYQGHGWGCAYLVKGEWIFYKNINPVWKDDFDSFDSTSVLIAHARSAFKDENIHVDYNMPFSRKNYVFIFNGELHGVRIKENGKMGAEKIFNYILRFDKGNIKGAIQKGVNIINKRSRYIKAMNFIIADKDSAYVYSDFNEDPDYFTMKYKRTADQIIIGSEQYAGDSNWHTIEKNSLKVM